MAADVGVVCTVREEDLFKCVADAVDRGGSVIGLASSGWRRSVALVFMTCADDDADNAQRYVDWTDQVVRALVGFCGASARPHRRLRRRGRVAGKRSQHQPRRHHRNSDVAARRRGGRRRRRPVFYFTDTLGQIPGLDGAGIVVATGSAVKGTHDTEVEGELNRNCMLGRRCGGWIKRCSEELSENFSSRLIDIRKLSNSRTTHRLPGR
jgi:hypothetical protein